MNKDVVLKEFLELKERGLIKDSFSTYEELLDVLSDMFTNEYEHSDDAQDAYNDLDDALENKISKFCGVYTLGSEEWDICFNENISIEEKETALNQWNEYYCSDNSSIDDLTSSIIHRVMKDMCNCGCDVYNALSMIIDDVFEGKELFFVNIGELNPRIDFMDI